MGNTFSNISVLKDKIDELELKKHVIALMQKEGLLLSEDNRDVCSIIKIKIIRPPNGLPCTAILLIRQANTISPCCYPNN